MSSNEPDPRLIRIAEALLRKTVSHEIAWDVVQYASDEQFDFSTEDMTVSLLSLGQNSGPYAMILKNEDGIELERLIAPESTPQGHETTLATLYATARRQALDIDARINDLAKSLGIMDLDEDGESL